MKRLIIDQDGPRVEGDKGAYLAAYQIGEGTQPVAKELGWFAFASRIQITRLRYDSHDSAS
jgi:hypothetical protein